MNKKVILPITLLALVITGCGGNKKSSEVSINDSSITPSSESSAVSSVSSEEYNGMKVDILNADAFGLTAGNSQYAEHTYTSAKSGIKYTGVMAATHGIQLRSKDGNSGIVGGRANAELQLISYKSTSDNPTNIENAERTVQFYGSNTPFTIEDMYKQTGGPELITEFKFIGEKESSLNVAYTGFSYIGIRSKENAIYLDKIIVTWNLK